MITGNSVSSFHELEQRASPEARVLLNAVEALLYHLVEPYHLRANRCIRGPALPFGRALPPAC